MGRDRNLTHGDVTEKGGFTDALVNRSELCEISLLEVKLTVTTDEAVPSAISKGEVRSRTVGGIRRSESVIVGFTHRIRFEAKLTSRFVRCTSLLLFLEAAAASSGLI